MTSSVAAWEDDGGAPRSRFGSPVVQRGNSDRASAASPSVKRKRQVDRKTGKLRQVLSPLSRQANRRRSVAESKQ
jgi:hypothetical protein